MEEEHKRILHELIKISFAVVFVGIPILLFLIWLKLIFWAIIFFFAYFIFLPIYIFNDRYKYFDSLLDIIKGIIERNIYLRIIFSILFLLMIFLTIWGVLHLTYIITKNYFPDELEKTTGEYKERIENCDIDSQTGRWICY